VDLDHLHPTCPAGTVNTSCVPAPFFGNLLQVMPWPSYQDMSDHDLLAIYTYLSAIPCVAGPSDPKDPLHNDCGTSTPPATPAITITITGPGGVTSATNTFTSFSSDFTVDASKSTSTNQGALTYSWTPSPGFPVVAIQNFNTAKPTFQLPILYTTYQFTLIVTDATGLKATATVTVQYN